MSSGSARTACRRGRGPGPTRSSGSPSRSRRGCGWCSGRRPHGSRSTPGARRSALVGVPPRPDGRYDLVVDGELVARGTSSGGIALVTDLSTGVTETREGPVGTVAFTDLPARDKLVELWLPHQEMTELVALRTDAPVAPEAPGSRRVWLHHGSSISQGSNAESPTTTWAALAAGRGGVDLVNLGFSGSAMLDPFVARTMRDLPADVVSVKIGINLTNGDVMRMRAFTPAVHGFLDTIRDGHPTTPLLVITPVLCPIHEDTPGPGAADFADGTMRFRATGDPADVAAGRLTLRTIRARAHPHRRRACARGSAPAPARRPRALRRGGLGGAPAARPAAPRRRHPPADGGAVRRARLRGGWAVRGGVTCVAERLLLSSCGMALLKPTSPVRPTPTPGCRGVGDLARDDDAVGRAPRGPVWFWWTTRWSRCSAADTGRSRTCEPVRRWPCISTPPPMAGTSSCCAVGRCSVGPGSTSTTRPSGLRREVRADARRRLVRAVARDVLPAGRGDRGVDRGVAGHGGRSRAAGGAGTCRPRRPGVLSPLR